MTGWLWMRVVWIAMLAMGGQPASAYLPAPPPEPVAIRFEAGSGVLTPAGKAAADRLAVRGARCTDGTLRVELRQPAETSPEQIAARYRAIHRRLAQLGVEAVYVSSASRIDARKNDTVLASIRSGDDERCVGNDSALLRRWVDLLAQHVGRLSSPVPPFWSQLTTETRRGEIALTLAHVAYCLKEGSVWQLQYCTPHPEVFDWLAERVGRQQKPADRERWLLLGWSTSEAPVLSRWRDRLRVAEPHARSKAWGVRALVSSNLSWAEIELRLLEPGVMNAVAAIRPDDVASVIDATVNHGRIDALPRLIAAAGTHAGLLYWELIPAAARAEFDADAKRLLSLLPSGYVQQPSNTKGLTVEVASGAYCPGARRGSPQRFAEIWEWLLSSGFSPEPEAMQDLTSRPIQSRQGVCWLQAVPGQPHHLRRVAPP